MISEISRAVAFRVRMLSGLVISSLLSVRLCLRDRERQRSVLAAVWSSGIDPRRVCGTLSCGVSCLSRPRMRAICLNECSRAGQGLSVHCCIGVPRIRLSVSRHASGFLRCVSSSLHFFSVGAFVYSSVSWRLVPAKLASNESTIRCANLATGVAPLAVPRSPGLSLRPYRSCATLSGLFRLGDTFR